MNDMEMSTFVDPLMDLLHSADLNKQVALSEKLLAYIEDISDSKIRQWCVDSLTILRDLERIELKLHGWEFTTLDYRLDVEKHSTPIKDDDIKLQLSRRVLKISLELYDQLNIEGENIVIAIDRSRMLSPRQLISDAGTILTELVLRLTKLREQLHKDISVGYSRAKLVIIGCELEKMVTDVQEDNQISSQLDPVIVNNYKQFVNTLLTQLEQSVTSGDTMSTMESIAIVNDVEKMFESMKQGQQADKAIKNDEDSTSSEKQDRKQKSTSATTPSKSQQQPSHDDYDYDSEGTLVSPTGSISSLKKSHRRTTSSLRADTELAKTTITEQLPSLMSAFQDESIKEEPEMESDDDNSDEDDHSNDSQTNTPEPEIPIPSLMNSLFGSPLLRAFYQPQMKEPIYIPKGNLYPSKSHDKLLEDSSSNVHKPTIKEEEESMNVIETVYHASKIHEDALIHERRMKQLQQIEQLRLPHIKPKTDFLVSPKVTALKEGRVKQSVKEIENPLLGGALYWPSSSK